MDITSLKTQATTIRDERERSANTATRVGRALLDTVNAIEENATTIARHTTDLTTAKADIAKFKAFYHGDLGDHTSWTEAQSRLDLMPTDGSVNGQYQISVGGIPYIVNFALLNNSAKIYTQSVIGSAVINSDGTLSTSHGIAVNIFSRTYTTSQWGAWTRLAALSEVPTAQEGTDGYKEVYIYSHKSDPDRQALSGNFKVISVSNGVELQQRVWGSTDFTDAATRKASIPIVNPSRYGVMNKDVFRRLLYHSHYETGSTTTAVNIQYTNYETGGTNTLTISAASSAKAGVMTTAQYNQLTELGNYYKGPLGSGTFATTDAFKAALNAMAQSAIDVGDTGRYRANVMGSFVFVTIAKLTSTDFAQWIEGPVIKSATDGDIYLNNELGVHLIGRVYANETWGQWRSTILDDELPLPASPTNDGLMSKEDYQLLQKIKAQLGL